MPLNLKGDHQERENLVDLGYYVHLVKSRLTSIVCFTILCTAIAVLIVLSTTPTYTATSTLLIESSQKKAISIEEVVGIDTTAKEYYLTQFEILKSNQVSKRVIEKLNLVENPEFNSKLNDTSTSLFDDWKAIAMNIKVIASFIGSPDDVELDQNATDVAYRRVLKEFKSRLTISPIRKTQLVNISFESEDPELAAIIANEIGQAFIENSLESKLVANEQATSWINQRLTELKQQLDRSERALLDFLERQELIDDSGIIALTSSELSNLTERIARASDKRIETQALYNALKGNKNVDVSTLASISLISNHPQIRDIRQAESDAAKIVSELSKRYGPKHDKMIQANAQLKSIQNRASSLILKLINGIEKELTSAINQEKLLKNELSSKKEEFQALSVVKREYDSLKREVDTNAKLYDLFLTRQKETSATSDFSSANARFSDYALVPESPSKPNKKLVVLISFFVSTGLAIALVVIQDALNKTIENARDFENKLRMLPTGSLPIVRDKMHKNEHIALNVLKDKKFSFFKEATDSIRTSLLLSLRNEDRKVLAVSSSVPDEGKTTTSISLAYSFSKLERVLLIDCDLRKGSLATRFSVQKSQPGITNFFLTNTPIEECIVNIEEGNLDVLPSGMHVNNPQEILSSRGFKELLDDLSDRYDRIIIDTPPILPVKDAFIVGKLSKGIILVVKANSTTSSVYKHTTTLFSEHQIKIDGVILNKVLIPKKGKHTYQEYSEYAREA